jgi:hypothetical protein
MCKTKLMRNNLIILLIFILGLFYWGCGPSAGVFKITENNQNVEVVSSKVGSIPNQGTINETEYQLPKTSKVEQVAYDDSLKSILIKYSVGKEGGFLFYNLENKKIAWTAKSDMSLSLMRSNDLLLRDPKGEKLYDAVSGDFIRNTEPYLYFLNSGKTLVLSPDSFALVDVRNGKRFWKQPGHEWTGVREVFENGEWVYVVAEGLHGLNLENGTKWEYLTSTYWKNVGKEVAKMAAVACISLGTVVPNYMPDVTMNMNSDPLVVEDKIFFAARDKMVCLDKLTGKIIWEIKIEPELEEMSLYNVSENEIALVGVGYKTVNYAVRQSDPPTVRIIRKEDGKIIGLSSTGKSAIAQSFGWPKDKFILLTQNQLLTYNKDLKLMGIVEAKKEYGNFIGLLNTGDTLIVRTSKGIAAISSDSFTEVWFQYCEVTPPEGKFDESLRPYYERVKVNNLSLFKYDNYWTPNENNGYTAYDLKTGKETMKLELTGKHILRYGQKCIVDFNENKIKIVTFD